MGKKRKQPSSTAGKIWYFIWHDNSIWSWLVNVVLAFVLIKFVFFPVLGALTGTALPIVAVVSESMDHNYVADYARDSTGACRYNGYRLCGEVSTTPKSISGLDAYWQACGGWYEERGMSKAEFSEFSLKNGFSKGDIILLVGKEPAEIDVGDTIVFQSQKPYPIIHRVVNKTLGQTGYVFQTKGDHNVAQINDPYLNELNVYQDNVIGVAVGKIPWLGWVKIGLVELLQGRSC